MHRHIISILLLFFASLPVHAMYVQDRDLISLHYDHAPDRDDGHATVAALAVVRSRGIIPHVVSGAYGAGNRTQYQPQAEQVMRQAWGSAWVNAHGNWQSAVNATASRWLNTLLNGGDIWIAEGGQSDFTSDVVRRIKTTNPGINTNNRIHVIQHSIWNEQMSDQGDLNYSRANTDYVKIDDGNGANATADLNQKSTSFVALARASQYGAAWNSAFQYLNPNNELLHILGVGRNIVATVNDFGAVYLSDQAPTVQPGSPTPWSDSYSVGGQCYCDTNFDHGLNTMSVNTPAGRRTIRQVCAAITSQFGAGSFQNRVYYNTVQCGHGPANNAPDEATCPGIPRGNNDYTGSRCQQTGSTWNLAALFSAPATTPPPAPAPEPTTQPQSPDNNVTIDFPECSSNVIDDNGDGYAWENNQTCVISSNAAPAPAVTNNAPVAPIDNPLVNFPVCSAAVNDDNGDGYAWENNQTCVVSANPPPAPVATTTARLRLSHLSTTHWSTSRYVVLQPTTTMAMAMHGKTTKPVLYHLTLQQHLPQQRLRLSHLSTTHWSTTVAPIDNPLINFPVCSSAAVDHNGDGYEWENNQTCVIAANTAQAPAVTTNTPLAPIDNPLVNFPVCSAAANDYDGDGYAWENNQTCVVPN